MATLKFPSVLTLVKSTDTPSPSIDTVVSSLDIVFLTGGGAVSPGVIISPLVRIAESAFGRHVPDDVSVPQVTDDNSIPVDTTLPVGRD
jgi:hypothetical protein